MTINKFEAAYFSDVSYSDNQLGFTLNQSYENAGWIRIKNSDDLGLSTDGYYGTAYAKVVNGTVTDVVIAHRGTEPNFEDVAIADGAIALKLPSNTQVDNAKEFARKVMEDLESRNDLPNNIDPNNLVTQTGHSLGGYLAIHAATQQSADSGAHVKAITFDNPKTGITSTNAIIETYLNPPGLVNSAGNGQHLGTVYRLDSSDPIFDNAVVSTLNSIAVEGVSNPSAAFAALLVMVSGGVLGVAAYGSISALLILQAIVEHPLGSIISRLETAEISAANYTTTGAISYYLVGDYSVNSTSDVGGVVASQWSLLENKAYYNNDIKQYADSFLNIVRTPGYEYSAKDIVVGSNGSDVVNLADSNGQTKFISTLGGDDSINASDGKFVVDGGIGNDTLTYENYLGVVGINSLNIDLATGATLETNVPSNTNIPSSFEVDKDIFTNIENVIGSKFDNSITKLL